jgi:hypothetical protein
MIDSATGKQWILDRYSITPSNFPMSGESNPLGLALPREATLYSCDSAQQSIRAIDTKRYKTYTVAGSGAWMHEDGIGTAASIKEPFFCDWDRAVRSNRYVSVHHCH